MNIKVIVLGTHQYLSKINLALLSRHTFDLGYNSDMLLNNLVETLTAWIKWASNKPIVTMHEAIQRQLLIIFHKKKKARVEATIRQASESLCLKIFKKLKKIKSESRVYVCQWQNELEFEVDHPFETHKVVDLEALTYSCGKWHLSRISCMHACVAIYQRRHWPKDYIADWNYMGTYLKSFDHRIHPMPSPEKWHKDPTTFCLDLAWET